MLPIATCARPASGPPEAIRFEDEVVRCWAPIVRLLRAVAAPGADVDDLAARVVEIAWRKQSEVHDLQELLPWMFAIARNVARNDARSGRRRDRLRAMVRAGREARLHEPAAHQALLDHEPGPATRALATLSRDDREVLVLHAWEGLGATELADVLDITRAAASQRLKRARQRLVDAMGEEQFE